MLPEHHLQLSPTTGQLPQRWLDSLFSPPRLALSKREQAAVLVQIPVLVAHQVPLGSDSASAVVEAASTFVGDRQGGD